MAGLKNSCFLAFDLGAESGRAILGKLKKNKLVIKEIHRIPNRPVSLKGHIHWNIYELFLEMKKALKACSGNKTERPLSLGIDTWGVDFGLIAGDGSIIGLPYCYRDSRTNGVMEEYFKLVSPRTLYEITGLQFMPFNSLFQLYAYIREKSPLLDSAFALLFMPDLFNYLFTGQKASEATIASTSQMLNARTRCWEYNLLQAMGFSKQLLQKIIQPGTVLGPVSREIADELGSEEVMVVATASHDTASAVAAVPAHGGDWAYISSGTWSLVGVELLEPVITEESYRLNFTNEGGVDGSIRFLKNVTGLWLLQGCRKIWSLGQKREITYEELAAGANNGRQFAAFIDPDSPVFLNPTNMVQAINDYFTLTKQKPLESISDLTRCILESLAFKYRLVINQLVSITRSPIKVIHIIGGGARNETLSQFTANATGLPVVAGPAEATSAGNILIQARSFGLVNSLSEAREIIKNSFELKHYEPKDHSLWEKKFEDYINAINT